MHTLCSTFRFWFFKEKLFQNRKTLQDDFILIGFWNLVDRENNEFNGNQLLDEKKISYASV